MTNTTRSPNLKPSLWRRLIAIWRLLTLVVFTLIVATSLALGRLILPKRAKQQWRIWHFILWSRVIIRGIGGRSQCFGPIPERPFYLACNHHSYLDILVLAQYVPSVFVSKAEVQHWPFFGWLTKIADTIYINREKRSDIPRANAAIEAALARGDGVSLFPEGTSSNSDWALPIRAPLLQVAAETGTRVHSGAIHFKTLAGDPPPDEVIFYFRDMSFVPHLWQLLHLRGFEVTVRLSDTVLIESDRKQLALQVRKQIHALQTINNGTTDIPDDIDDKAITMEAMRQ
ncbi:MAG: lysophospholipid acyltransferase family protein [Pseudomonadota bacterium]